MAKNKLRKLKAQARPHGHAAQAKKQDTKPPALRKQIVKPTIPFGTEDRILLVGEGDFSFARSIVEHHGCCDVTATCFDSQQELFAKYEPQAEQNISYLDAEGQSVLYQVDATCLDKTKVIRTADKFKHVLFNFPHVGGKSTDVNRQVRFNQELIFKFFKSAASLLAHDGSIIVTLFEGEPYTLWNIKDLARSHDLAVDRSFAFHADAYPGYKHARTLGNIDGGGGWKGELRSARSYVFKSKGQKTDDIAHRSNEQGKKRKHEPDLTDDDSGSD